jgi:CheY-like chemotaxis protein
VLVVENESAIRTLVQMALERHGYTVLGAESGADALRVSENHKGDIHLLITDVIIPVMNGPELSRQLAV